MTNGQMSPLFLGLNQHAGNLQRVDINFVVRRIRGTQNGCCMTQLHFHDESETKIARIQCLQQSFASDQLLNEGEEIVGIFGVKNPFSSISAIGFIVWNPRI